jgi:ATP-dependent helicase STH1/SNF2
VGFGESLLRQSALLSVLIVTQAIEEGEDIEELAERAREARRNNPYNDQESSPPPEPVSSRGRKNNKKKGAAPVDVGPSKRKRAAAVKAQSLTPSVQDEEEDDRTAVRLVSL